MAEISKIKLPSGNTYDLKDAVAREMISGGVAFNICWDGTSTPTESAIPAGVVVKYNNVEYTGSMLASSAQPGTFYLVYNSDTANNSYSEYVTVGPAGSKTWEKIGDTVVDLSNLGDLAYLDTVTLSKGSGDNVLGEATTFTTTVTPTTTNIKATASETAVGADGTAAAITGFGNHTTDNFVTSVSAETNKKLVTSDASKCSFTMGSGSDAETLIIGCSDRTVATGATATNGTGDSIVTGVTIGSSAAAITALGTPTTSNCLTGVKVTSQPTVALSTGATAGTGVISVATGITSASTTAGNDDTIKIAKYNDLSVSAS